jgi:hypothetical protein
MITCNLCGGLGNQLFQIFATISHAIELKQKFGFIYSESSCSIFSPRPVYWNSFLKSLHTFTFKNLDISKFTVVNEKSFNYTRIPYSGESNILLGGYFQSYKYFEKNLNLILSLIKFEDRKNECIQKYGFKVDDSISMHFRLGDYKKLSHVYPIMTVDYYKNSLLYIFENRPSLKNKTVLYFCEKEDESIVSVMIDEIKKGLPENVIFEKAPDNMEDWEEMIMMSCCDSNIIANSTFSLFAAYFNINPDKIVCYPSIWFADNKINVSDLFPVTTNWKKI